jgi:ABC-2 type transport system ATP-binding protein
MSKTVVFSDVSKWYGKVLGVCDVNIEITEGVVGLLGPNGAGKSTFLKLLAGQIRPNIGQIRVFGKDVFSSEEVFGKIGYCPEFDSYFKNMTAFEFVRNLLLLQGFSTADAAARAKESLEKLGLFDVSSRQIKTFSMGMRQRLRIAQSLSHDPDLLLLDEPLNGVDPVWRLKVMDIVREISKNRKTVIVSSHVLPEVEQMTDEIILIHQGKIFAQGNIHYIRSLIDSKPHIFKIKLPEPKKLAKHLLESDSVLGLDFAEEELRVKTLNRENFVRFLAQKIADYRIEIDEIDVPDDNLQSVFDYLVA